MEVGPVPTFAVEAYCTSPRKNQTSPLLFMRFLFFKHYLLLRLFFWGGGAQCAHLQSHDAAYDTNGFKYPPHNICTMASG